jgi:hypothetical protein
MREETVAVYKFSELDDEAKGKARDWFLQGFPNYDWWQCVYDDAEMIGLKIIEFDEYNVKAKFIDKATDCAKSIMREHGENCETYKTAEAFMQDIEPLSVDNLDGKHDDEIEKLEKDFLKSLSEDYRIMLRKEYEYLTSTEHIDESIISNEYEFTANGKIF